MSTYGDLKISTINGGPLSGFRNAIINGDFGINQRAVSGTVTLAAGVYGHDRWKAGASGCTYTFATSENVTTITISAGSLIQVVEGLNLMTGTYTLSWEGTAQGKIGAGSYGNSGITGSVTGGTNLNIEFGTGTLRLVQLEKGSVATPFEFRSIGQELALCQRYYQKYTYDIKGVPTLVRITSGINEYDGSMPIPTMRASPTFATTSTQVHKPGVRSESFTVGVYTGPTFLALDVTPATNDSTCNAAFFRDGSFTLTAEL